MGSRRGMHTAPWPLEGCRLRHDCGLFDHASMFVDERDWVKDELLWTFLEA